MGTAIEPIPPAEPQWPDRPLPPAPGPTGGQVVFDILFGLASPIVLMLADPALFSASVARTAALPPYLATPVRAATGALVACLLLWGLSGMRRPGLGILLGGFFAFGAFFEFAIGLVLLGFAITHADLLSGWLALTPWLSAFVFARHSVRAARVGAQRSLPGTILFALVGLLVPAVVLGVVGARRHARARVIEALLLSGDRADYELATSMLASPSDLDFDRIAEFYAQMKEDDPRRPRLAEVHLRFTGVPIEEALNRLYPKPPREAAVAQKPKKPKETEQARVKRLIGELFSQDPTVYQRAYDELLTYSIRAPRGTFDEIARRYAIMPANHPDRERIARAYRDLCGEPIEAAVERLRGAPRPKKP